MPEIAEVACIVKRLNQHLAGQAIASITAVDDNIVFKDTTRAAFSAALTGRTVQAAKQWGKYFWLVMDKPPHPLMHFGMTGWVYIKNDPNAHYRAPSSQPEWPPKYAKFTLHLPDSNEIAFSDARRLSRIRLIDHTDGYALRTVPPLSENGPDPLLDPPKFEWLQSQLASRKVPVKAWLLDQSALAGIGNWVGDEILFHAKIHPESYTNNLLEEHVTELHKAIQYVCRTAVDCDADSERFPDGWLMKHRWGKGKKASENKLPTGESVQFVKVGGRTSAWVLGVQKKVGPLAGGGGKKVGVGEVEDDDEEQEPQKLKKEKTKAKQVKDEDNEDKDENVEMKKLPKRTKSRGKPMKEDVKEDKKELARHKRKASTHEPDGVERSKKSATSIPKDEDELGRRRSTRNG